MWWSWVGGAALAKSALEAGLALGRRASGVGGPLKRWRQAQVKQFLESGSALRLQYPKEDLGFTYAASPGGCAAACMYLGPRIGGHLLANTIAGKGVVPDDDPGCRVGCSGAISREPLPGMQHSAPAAAAEERGAPYRPTTAPGARLPHCQLQLRGDTVSTHDLLPAGGVQLLLLTGASAASRLWVQAAASHPLLWVVAVAVSDDDAQRYQEEPASSSQQPEVAVDFTGRWQRLREVHEDGALLVRPDGHVAWRSLALLSGLSAGEPSVSELRSLLQTVVDQVLSRTQ